MHMQCIFPVSRQLSACALVSMQWQSRRSDRHRHRHRASMVIQADKHLEGRWATYILARKRSAPGRPDAVSRLS
ncbi:hypothetical protein MGYG_01389 [Nannizzia gypsea CBS 118893]|uniref:Uncharacterized protein n=1 Tax=Arthroderma gypseum (strain ATCC MYA-4604 / CBS 118893) TaxID=535722 RepID=E5R0L3_ARTGP|nr:hypothetical protein MGYG_01389 [Nannizzia gypsea CBS 118893]EFQ98357.1 hypothetical protein MGYG_01389 [Nannizzia gypsea CBS 118893]